MHLLTKSAMFLVARKEVNSGRPGQTHLSKVFKSMQKYSKVFKSQQYSNVFKSIQKYLNVFKRPRFQRCSARLVLEGVDGCPTPVQGSEEGKVCSLRVRYLASAPRNS